MPVWKLVDFQPKSPRYQQTYGLESFKGKVTFVSTLATWCSFCRRQIEKMEALQKNLKADGHEVNFVVINIASGSDSQQEFTQIASFPLFQDTAEVDAFSLHQAAKDDFYLYGRHGELRLFSSFFKKEHNLTIPEGFLNVRQAILDAFDPPALTVDTVAAISIDGDVGDTYRIFYSDDLGEPKDWNPLATLTLETSPQIFVDLHSIRRQRRFYKVETLDFP